MPGIVCLATRVKEPNERDWKKVIKILNYLQARKAEIANMSTNNNQTINLYVDSSFAIYKNMKSHTGAIMTLGNRAIISNSTKQK